MWNPKETINDEVFCGKLFTSNILQSHKRKQTAFKNEKRLERPCCMTKSFCTKKIGKYQLQIFKAIKPKKIVISKRFDDKKNSEFKYLDFFKTEIDIFLIFFGLSR